MDDGIGDIKNTILDLQKTLLLQCEEEVLAAEVELRQLHNLLASLDAVCSLGIVAQENNFVRPQLTEDRHLVVIKGGRHPLQTVACNRAAGGTFVPNDTFVTHEKHVALITGANGSGKSVYLKQVCIHRVPFRQPIHILCSRVRLAC